MAIADIILPVTFKSDTRGLKKAEDRLKKFGTNVGKIALGATAAVAGIGALSVRAFAGFDDAMNQSLAIMGDVSDAMRDDMAEAARTVAKETTFSAEQAAESFFFLASAGMDAADSIKALPQVAAFAQAGQFDMATATDLLTDSQSALGLSSDDTAQNMENLARVSDVLVNANTTANATVQEFAESLTNKAANSMSKLGIEVEEGIAVLSVFADQGIKGSEAGTRFNAAIRGLTGGAEDNAEAFAKLGIEVYDSEGNFNNFADIIEDLEKGLDGMSTEQQRATLGQLGFTEETLAGILALEGNSQAIRDYEESAKLAGGTTEEVADKQLESFSAQLSLLKSSLEDVGIEIGGALVPSLTSLVDFMKPAIEEAGPALKDMFLALVPVIMDLVKGFPDFVDAMIPLIPLLGDIALMVGDAAVILFPLFLDILNAILPVFVFLAGALKENLGLIVGIVASIGAFVAVGTAVSNMITIFSAFKTVMIASKAFMLDKLIPAMGKAIAALARWGFAILKFIGKMALKTALLIGQVVTFAVHKAATFAMIAATKLATLAQKGFNMALRMNPIGLIITGVLALVAGLIWFFTKTEVGQEMWAGFTEFLSSSVTAIADFFTYVFTEWIPGLWESLVDGLTTGWTTFKEYFFEALGAIGDFFKGIINGWIGLFEGFVNFVIGGVNKLIGALNSISIDIPATKFSDAFTIGVSIPTIPEVSLPRLAEGGIVDSTTIAMIGEAGPEAVIPLDRLGDMGGGSTYNITVNAGMGTDPVRVGEEVVGVIRRYERASGKVFASA